MTLRDELTRAAVYEAFTRRDEHGRVTAAAAQHVIDVHRTASLLECAPVLDAVAAWLDERRCQEEDAELDWYAAALAPVEREPACAR